ncbi:MAG: tRNA-dihydrouridine synthase family protein [Bacteroidales bacterium]
MNNNSSLKIHLAPLQGHTDSFFRNAHQDIFEGVDTYYTPFVRLEKGHNFRSRELRDIRPENNTVSDLVPQLIASTSDELKEIADLFIENGYKKADLNMGCPFPMLARRHKGSGLIAHPDEVEKLLKAMTEIPELSFSIKMRLGWDSPDEAMKLVSMLNDAPLTHIGLHARLGKQQYKGETDIESFSLFYDQCKHPIFYNGDLRTIEDIQNISSRFSKLEGVMIGRGLLANPALASEFKNGESMDTKEKKRKMQQLHDQIFAQYSEYLQGDKQLLEKMKAFWEYLSDDLEKRTRKKIEKASKLSQYEAAVSMAFSQWGKVEHTESSEETEDAFLL